MQRSVALLGLSLLLVCPYLAEADNFKKGPFGAGKHKGKDPCAVADVIERFEGAGTPSAWPSDALYNYDFVDANKPRAASDNEVLEVSGGVATFGTTNLYCPTADCDEVWVAVWVRSTIVGSGISLLPRLNGVGGTIGTGFQYRVQAGSGAGNDLQLDVENVGGTIAYTPGTWVLLEVRMDIGDNSVPRNTSGEMWVDGVKVTPDPAGFPGQTTLAYVDDLTVVASTNNTKAFDDVRIYLNDPQFPQPRGCYE